MTIDEKLDMFDDELDQAVAETDEQKRNKRLVELHRLFWEFKDEHENEWATVQGARFLEQCRTLQSLFGPPADQSAP